MSPELFNWVKLVVGILYSDAGRLRGAFELMEESFGPVDFISHAYPFDISDYYHSEMGESILRRFISFDRRVHPGSLADIKRKTCEMEKTLSRNEKRKVNLDPGIMDYDKLVLASYKYNGQKIYLDKGVWADLTLYYRKGHFHPYAWSFPDFKRGHYESDFLRIRELYKKNK